MKNAILTILMLAMFCIGNVVCAQPHAADLKTGDAAPSLTPLKWIKGSPIKQFDKGHIYVLEFGATWCVPCAAAVPELTLLGNQYKEITIAGLFVMEQQNDPPGTLVPSYLKTVEEYVHKQGNKMQYNVAVDDAAGTLALTWLKPAQLIGLPHIFVIDPAGKIAWIGSNPKVLRNVIEMVRRKDYDVATMVKRDSLISSMHQEYNILTLMNKEDLDRTLYFSHLSIYKEGQTGVPNYAFVDNFRWARDDEMRDRQGKIQVLGETLRRLYYLAYGDTLWNEPPSMYPPDSGIYPDTIKNPHQKRSYGKYWYRPILEVTDSSLFEAEYTSPKNRFNYVLKIPLQKASSQYLQHIMQGDLKTCFGYEVTVEERMMPCWNLTVSRRARAKLKTRSPGVPMTTRYDNGIGHITNAQVRDFIFQLEIKYGHTSLGNLVSHPDKQPPFIDATGIDTGIDYTYDRQLLHKLTVERRTKNNFEDYRKFLEAIGFDLVKSYKKMKVVVIRDPVQ